MSIDAVRRCSARVTCVIMSIYSGSKILGGFTVVGKRCQHCLKGASLLKTLLVAFCVMMVVQQVSVSIRKLIDIPITTYTHFDFNKTIAYPSVTFCREPPYKIEKLMQYGFTSYPYVPRAWSNFNFSSILSQQLWDEITYDDKEVFFQYTLDGLPRNLNLTSTYGLTTGRCFTLSPNVRVNRATLASGYSVTLQHTDSGGAIGNSAYPPGYHVYVHYVKEPYTEVEVYNGGLVDYLYVNSGETVDVKLTVDKYIKISDEINPCTDALNYSANNCTTKFVWDTVTSLAGCSGPWMTSDLPYCSNYSDMSKLISTYIFMYRDHEHTGCPRICRSYLYNAYVTARQTFFKWDSSENQWFVAFSGSIPSLTQVYIHFNSMMVSVYEERYNYDWNMFLSELGGSIGFLLGLSVISLMKILSNVWYAIKSETAWNPEKVTPSINPADTMNLATIDQYKDHNKKFSCYNVLHC